MVARPRKAIGLARGRLVFHTLPSHLNKMAPSAPPLLDPAQIQLQPSSDSPMIGAVHHAVEQQQPQAPEQQQQHTAIAMQQPGCGVHFACNTTDAVTHVAVQLAQAAPATTGRRVMLNSVPSNSSMHSRVHIGSRPGSHELTDSASVISHAPSTCHAKGALEERPMAQNYFQIKRSACICRPGCHVHAGAAPFRPAGLFELLSLPGLPHADLRVSESVKAELQRFDADGDGILDGMQGNVTLAMSWEGPAALPLLLLHAACAWLRHAASDVSAPVKHTMYPMDTIHASTCAVDNVTALVEHMLEENTKHRMYRAAAAGLIVFTLLLLGSMFGLTWAVVAALKDTQVREGGVLLHAVGQGGPHSPNAVDLNGVGVGHLVCS